MLGALGVTEAEEALYKAVLAARQEPTVSELAESTGRPVTQLRRCLAALEARGMVARIDGRPVRFRPAPPELAIEVLAMHSRHQIERARLAATELSGLWALVHQENEVPVQVVRGSEANVQRFLLTQMTSKEEVLTLDKPPYVAAGVPRQTEVQLDLMARGVRYRTIYDRQSLAEADSVAVARELARHGEQARVLDGVPLKLLITDRANALVPYVLSEERQTVALGPSPLLDGLLTLFEFLWERSTPLWSTEPAPQSDLKEEDVTLLGFAAAGYTDEVIARKVGVNKRTIERRMRRIMDVLGARTRFQAGLQAGLKGVLR
ncbi:helix-turn-helix domain-containing protein [Streptomyces sp. NPDC127074]|uniref:helix-turn-helix domain-containing protein n=1 Tax=Streptomyces sp. NPDC127074 TaxID=3347130 RepID=UPI0036542E25